MNLRKTIAGAVVALGSTAVMLGLGGVAQAAEVGAEARPELDTGLGEIASVGDALRVDTEELGGRLDTLDLDSTDPEVLLEGNLQGPLRDLLREKAGHVPNVDTGIVLGS